MEACASALNQLSGMAYQLGDSLSPILASALALSGLHQLDDISSKLGDTEWLWQSLTQPLTFSIHPLLLLLGVFALVSLLRILRPAKTSEPVFVLDFSVHKPESSWAFSRTQVRALCEKRQMFTTEDIDFQEKIAYRTGLGDETAVCPAIQSGDAKQLGIEAARFEFGATCFTTIAELLEKTGVQPKQVDYIITNSSLFNPTPSLSAAIMNHFKMGAKCINYSLGGMGCSAGVIALDLAKELLELHPNKIALVVSHENITNNYYCGKDRSMLIPNCLFRSNGSAVLLSNKAIHARRAKYTIPHIVRTNMAANDVAYNCVMQTEDAEGKLGVRLNKDLIKVGADALKANMTALGPLVLPWSEQLKFAANAGLRMAAKKSKPLTSTLPAGWLKPYIPDFTKAFDYFCIHTGGRGIIDGLEKEMQLSREAVEPSRASLYRFGNTSSTSVWYELAYIESTHGVANGQRVWQLAFGSGFKFNSAVLQANRQIKDRHAAWETEDAEGKLGVRLNKDLIKVGADALKANMTALGPLVLPWSEQLKFAANAGLRMAAKKSKPLTSTLPAGWLKPYIPDFTKAFDYFCIHTGGRGIIDGLEKEMQLSREAVEPSRASLYRFGNTSSTSVWYELAYIESTHGVANGQRVWQLAFGSGFKFNSAVLQANRQIKDRHAAWEGFDAAAMWVELDQMNSVISSRPVSKLDS